MIIRFKYLLFFMSKFTQKLLLLLFFVFSILALFFVLIKNNSNNFLYNNFDNNISTYYNKNYPELTSYNHSFFYTKNSVDEISDVSIELKPWYSYEDSSIEFFVTSNKSSILMSDIFYAKNNSLEKLVYLDYIKSFWFINWYDLFPKASELKYFYNDKNILLEKQNYSFENNDANLLLSKYFVLSYMDQNFVFKNWWFSNKIKNDFIKNFEFLDYDTRLKFLFYSSELWELEEILSKNNLDIFELIKFQDLNINQATIFYYILSNNPKYFDFWDKILNVDFYELNYLSQIFYIWYLNNIWENYDEYYDYLENNYNNNDLWIWEKFLKLLVFNDLQNEYNSYSDYSRFWYSIWYIVNRNEEFEILENQLYLTKEFSLDRISYDDDEQIDLRLTNFEWDEFYTKIILKQR